MHGGLKGLTQAPGGERGTLPAGSRRARGRLLLRCEVATAKWVAMQIPGVGKGSSNSHRTSAALMLTATLAEGSTAGTGCWVCRVCGGIGGDRTSRVDENLQVQREDMARAHEPRAGTDAVARVLGAGVGGGRRAQALLRGVGCVRCWARVRLDSTPLWTRRRPPDAARCVGRITAAEGRVLGVAGDCSRGSWQQVGGVGGTEWTGGWWLDPDAARVLGTSVSPGMDTDRGG